MNHCVSERLQGKVAVVVGAGQTKGDTIGCGRATAILFARAGAKLILVSRKYDSVIETHQQILQEGGESHIVLADVTKEEECHSLINQSLAVWGRIDILHYNAGHRIGDSKVTNLDINHWDTILNTNLRGFSLVCKYVLQIMQAQNSGVITAISSIASVITKTSSMAYKASKAGMNAIAQALAIEYAPLGIRINVISPGLMDTPMAIELRERGNSLSREEIRAERQKKVPLKSIIGTGWDVAHAALFLSSEEARYITGIVLPVDGGLSTKRGYIDDE